MAVLKEKNRKRIFTNSSFFFALILLCKRIEGFMVFDKYKTTEL